jgi:hypothetical protein
MFILSESEIGDNSLKTISRIDINFYNTHNDILNIFYLEHKFDENIIPLITSVLECQPNLFYRKTYSGLDNDYIINYLVKDFDKEMTTKFQIDKEGFFPSFFLDIEALNAREDNKYKKFYRQTRNLLSSICYKNSKELVRIYSRDARDARDNSEWCDIWNVQDTFSHKVEKVISWSISSWCVFEMCISKTSKCIWNLKIDVIEDVNFINSKVDDVNIVLEKIHKIIHSSNSSSMT